MFDRNFLFAGKSIKQENVGIKKINKAEDRGWKVPSDRNGVVKGGIITFND
jgi:hypothetical protein